MSAADPKRTFQLVADAGGATQVSAGTLGQAATRGTIAPGMRADLVVLVADPVADIHNTTKFDFMVKRGLVYQRAP